MIDIAGLGIVFARGRGLAALEQALREGWRPPDEVAVDFLPAGQTFPCYQVAPAILADKTLPGSIRRADRFSKLAVLAARDALQDSGLEIADKTRLGVIVATAFGPHVTTFRFLDDLLDYGDLNGSPTTFSHSVHNAAAAYIATVLESRGPTLTLTHFSFAFHHALLLADIWLAEGRCAAVLVGAVDECGTVQEYICRQKLHIPVDRRIKPFAFAAAPAAVPGEGSVFLLVTSTAAGKKKYGAVETISLGAPDVPSRDIQAQLLDADGMLPDESGYARVVRSGVPTGAYTPLVGTTPLASAFQGAVAALMLKQQVAFACPDQTNPRGVPLLKETRPLALRRIACTRLDCAGNPSEIISTSCQGHT